MVRSLVGFEAGGQVQKHTNPKTNCKGGRQPLLGEWESSKFPGPPPRISARACLTP